MTDSVFCPSSRGMTGARWSVTMPDCSLPEARLSVPQMLG